MTATVLVETLERLADLAARNVSAADDLAMLAEVRREIQEAKEMGGAPDLVTIAPHPLSR